MKSKAWTEKFMRGVFFIAACASVLAVALILCVLICKWYPRNVRNRILRLPDGKNVET